MAEKEIKIKFTIDGIEQEVDNLEDFQKAVKKAGVETKKAAEEATIFGDLKDKFNNLTAPIKKVVASMKTLKGAIAATGIGLLITAIASLVAYFKSSEEGSRKLAIAMEALSLLFGKLMEVGSKIGSLLVDIFTKPKQYLLQFAELIKQNIINRFEGLLELIPNLGSAISELFKGNFSNAGKIATDALAKVVLGVEDITDKVGDAVDAVVEFGSNFVSEVNKAIATATSLVDAQRALRDQQQKLIVENANLTKQLEEQKKIAEDTSLAYEERAAALEKVGETQIKLAENVAAQAAAEENLLRLQIQNANTYEEREELETQLAEATASRIEAQTQLSIVELEAAKLSRELELEELDRKRSINDMLTELDKDKITDAFELAKEELRIAEDQMLAELTALRATEEEKQKVRDAFAAKQKKVDEENAKFKIELQKKVEEANLGVVSEGLGAIQSLLGENSKAAKMAAIAQTTVDTYVAAQKAYASQLIVGDPTSPVRAAIAAGVAIASGLANVKAIINTKVPGAEGGGGAVPTKPNIPRFAPQQTTVEARNNVVTPTGSGTVVKAYVVSSDMTSQQEADKKINDLATL